MNSRIQTEADAAIKALLVMSFSAQMPAYTYTSLWTDPKCRKVPVRKKVQYMASADEITGERYGWEDYPTVQMSIYDYLS